MTDHEIKPALTPEQWGAMGAGIPDAPSAPEWSRVALSSDVPNGVYVEELGEPCASVHVHPRARHALAALCLHGQPFGFNAAHVAFLKTAADEFGYQQNNEYAEELRQIAALIAALLPPSP